MEIKGGVLDRLTVASPCSAKWEEMAGDERVRFCRLCELKVYNLSAMGREEAERLVENREGRLCARFYQRADGTVITRDCPVGLAAVRRRVRRVAGAFAAMIGILMTGAISFGQGNKRLLGLRLRDLQPFAKVSEVLVPGSTPTFAVMGDICIIPSTSSPKAVSQMPPLLKRPDEVGE